MTAQFEFTTTNTVRYSDCDMHAHMNHASYFAFFEQARVEYFAAIGMHPTSKRESIPFIVVHVSADYRAQAQLSDVIEINIGITKFGNTSFTMQCAMFREGDRELLCECTCVCVSYDYPNATTTPVPQSIKDAVSALQQGR